jgi:hypothetical protein
MFFWNGTALPNLIGPISFYLAWHYLIVYLLDQGYLHQFTQEVGGIQSAMNIFLSMTLGWKVSKAVNNNSNALIYKRIGEFRGLVKHSCNYELKDYSPETVAKVDASREIINNKANTLWAFMRQGLRESIKGFHPGSAMADTKFGPETFWQDPCQPYLSDMITVAERTSYGEMPVSTRVGEVSKEIQAEAENLAMLLAPNVMNGYMQAMNNQIAKINAQNTMAQSLLTKNGGSLPFIYNHVCLVLLNGFCLLTPFSAAPHITADGSVGGAVSGSPMGAFLLTVIIVSAYFGTYMAACRLSDPWGWDKCDYNLEKTGRGIVKQQNLVMAGRILKSA